jgi:hypothetical protein
MAKGTVPKGNQGPAIRAVEPWAPSGECTNFSLTMNAHVSPPIGDAGNGVTAAFVYALDPTRTCATANANVVRISVKNGAAVLEFLVGILAGPRTIGPQ